MVYAKLRYCKREISYNRNATCTSCKGTGAKNGTAYTTCAKCGGTGQIQYATNNGFFRSVSVRDGDECHGTGKKFIENCPDCKGKGHIKTPTNVTLNIPAGADTGSYLRKQGFGEASSNGGPSGDLIVIIKVEPSKIFKRKDFDLYVTVPISFKTAVLGGKVSVPLLDEVMEYTIPEGTQSGKIFFVRGKGIKTPRGSGDLYIEIMVEVPTKLTKEQKKALDSLESDSDYKQNPEMKKYKDNIETMYGKNPYAKK